MCSADPAFPKLDKGLKVPLFLLSACSRASASEFSLDILHLNDNHARFDPADANFGTQCSGGAADACFGGMARLATALDDARAAAAARGADTLVLHAGDQLTGTLWDSIYTRNGTQIAPDLLEMLGVQALALGNHEFDYGATGAAGLEGFARAVDRRFPLLSCNLDASGEPALAGLVDRYTIVELPRSKALVGIVGLTSVETPETSNPGPTIKFLPHNETLPGCVDAARRAGAQIVVALTHIGFDQDQALAADAAAAGVDMFIGGHTHTLLWGAPPPVGEEQVGTQPPAILASPPTEEKTVVAGPYPTLVANPVSNKTVPVLQALYASRYLGSLQTTWDASKGLVGFSGQPILLGGVNSTNPVEENADVLAALDALRGPLDEYSNESVGSATINLDGERVQVRNGETNLADLMCEAMLQYTKANTGLLQANPDLPPVCLINGGVIRASIPAGQITQGLVETVLPYGNWLIIKRLPAQHLVPALNSGLSGWTGDVSSSGRFPQVAGLRYAFDPAGPDNASRLVAAQLLAGVDGQGVPLASYQGDVLLLTTDYVAGGGDFYTMFSDAPIEWDSSTPLDVILSDHLKAESPVSTTVDGRIANCAATPDAPLCAARAPAAESRGPARRLLLLAIGTALVPLPAAAAASSGPAAPGVTEHAEYDAYALRRLRAAIAAADPGWTAGISGWGSPPADTTDPCAWRGVGCDEARRVTTIQLRNVGSASASSSAGGASGLPLAVDLPPELASLPRLQSLELVLVGPYLLSPLPYGIEPGALPMLHSLQLGFSQLHSTLPPGWGADSRVLPRLHELRIRMQVEGGFPPEWVAGFRRLTLLDVSVAGIATTAGRQPQAHTPAAGNPVAADGMPSGWAAGFKKDAFILRPDGHAAATAAEWPPAAAYLWLPGNYLTGTLPAAWASAQLVSLSVRKNFLTGPAFPPAFLAPGALPQLSSYDVEGNVGLTGTLPTTLPPQLTNLLVQDTGLTGTVPAAWCNHPIARNFDNLLSFVLQDDDQPVILGETKSAAVVLGSLHGKPVAVKIQEPPPGIDSRRLWQEARLMQRCTHPRIAPLLAVGVHDGAVLQVMELMQGGTLCKAIERPGMRERLRWEAGGRQVAMDVAEGLDFLHSQAGVQHDDLKSSNVLLTADLRACISDLGASQLAASMGRSVIGLTLCYAAPEQLLGRCTVASDMFSFGVLLIEIATQTPVTRRGQWRLPLAPKCSQDVLDLIKECLEVEPERRPSAAAPLRRCGACEQMQGEEWCTCREACGRPTARQPLRTAQRGARRLVAAQADEGSSGSAPAAATDDGAVAAEQLLRRGRKGGKASGGKAGGGMASGGKAQQQGPTVVSPVRDQVYGGGPLTFEQKAENTVVSVLAILFFVILGEGIFLGASGFLSAEMDQFAQDVVFPAFTPTLGLFLAISTGYGVLKTRDAPKNE
ncbi:5 -nucleotidase isoform B [Micractinium conductrix]|nr:5 -nucleotidase isoform B [Micractinium conductrix]|eukprot:PSC75913.1 5 -nucleotidase isoform B [Micractinium conductrix]